MGIFDRARRRPIRRTPDGTFAVELDPGVRQLLGSFVDQLRGRRLLAMIVAQGAIGYAQYELGIPEWLVILHIAGATAIVGLTMWFHLGLSGPTGRNATSRGTPA